MLLPHNSRNVELLLIKFYIEDLHTNLSNRLKFHKDWHSGSCALGKSVNTV